MAAANGFDLQHAGKLFLRVGIAIVMLFHGVYKLRTGVGWIAEPLGQLGLPSFLALGTYLAELIAPVMLIVGFKTRIAALVIAFDMVAAVVLVLQPSVLTYRQNSGGWSVELEFLLLMSSVALVFLGGGKYGLGKGRWD
jgi:putative oxidoreductase